MGFQYPLERVNVSASTALAELRSRSARHGSATRDPRAAPLTIHRNVAIVETCRFYGVADALTSCRVPRSCQDCLRMPGCAISYDGQCENVTAPWMENSQQYDYRTALTAATPRGTAYNRTLTKDDSSYKFFAGNATYCGASDAICSACRATFHELARSRSTIKTIGGQFCVGMDGCVCIAVCEVPEILVARGRDTECAMDTSSKPIVTTLDPPKLISYSSRRRDPRSPTAPVTIRHTNVSCGYYDELDVQGCRAPRSCRDCLQREGCMISGYKCVDMTLYKPESDFRQPPKALAQYSFFLSFPAENTTYCPHEDATCTACRADFEAKRLQSIGSRGSSDSYSYKSNATFCVGAGGCVCIELCENTALLLDEAKDTDCFLATKREVNQGHYFVLALSVLFISLFHLGTWARDRRRPHRGRPQEQQTAAQLWRHMLDQTPQVLQLDLFGWRRYQQELQDKELELLTGAQDVSPVARPMGFDNTDPTAPDFDEDDSSAPIATNPAALASAPMYRLRRRSPGRQSASEPTAPTFDDE